MAEAAEELNLTIQLCMSLPRHALMSVSLPAVTQVHSSIQCSQILFMEAFFVIEFTASSVFLCSYALSNRKDVFSVVLYVFFLFPIFFLIGITGERFSFWWNHELRNNCFNDINSVICVHPKFSVGDNCDFIEKIFKSFMQYLQLNTL